MPTRKTADKLLSAKTKREREKILRAELRTNDLQIAFRLKTICYEVWTSNPVKAQKAALALEVLAEINPDKEIRALAHWVAGIAELTKGRLEKAVENLTAAGRAFRRLGRELESANTEVAKLIALGLLGKYSEAVKTGRSALKIFEKYGDELAAGKIEMNLSNIVSRRARHREAEKYCLSALKRFQSAGEKSWETMAQNGLGNTYSELNDFRRAEKFYAAALATARSAEMRVTEAEIEASMGNLALFRGKFDDGLRLLEFSRQKYEELRMPHQKAVAELEIADIYLELNLTDEAEVIYEKVTDSLRRLKLQGEEARARAGLGKTALLKKDFKKAKAELKKSARLFFSEKNPAGAASVKLTEANLELSRRNYQKAFELIVEAEKIFAARENPRQKLFADWLKGDTLRFLQKNTAAEKLLRQTLETALSSEQMNLAQVCLNSLGNLALQTDSTEKAVDYFSRAVRLIENLRAPLPAEEFRMAFFADKLYPYQNLARIYLSQGEFEKAFLMLEKSRARALFDSLIGNFSDRRDPKSSKLTQRLADLREELNWFYSRLNRAETVEIPRLQKEVRQRERRIAEVLRQIESTRSTTSNHETQKAKSRKPEQFGLELLQKSLGGKKALIEFVKFDERISAFVVTENEKAFFENLVTETELLTHLEGLRFQFGALRYGAKNLGAFLAELKNRADFYLQTLYDKLFAPLAAFVGNRDLVVVPVGAVNYVPFGALKNEHYLVESREIVSAPSAQVWHFLQSKPSAKTRQALLLGFADERIPLVGHELEALQEIFPTARVLSQDAADFENFSKNAPKFDILHLACHGQFRPDNPLFSSLHLADGFVTVRDICAQRLKAELVTLSACETGLSKIYAGDEILGLARGFLSAGARHLILSLWTVNDEATSVLMKEFYTNLQRGHSVAASLKKAQKSFIERGAHPYFWSSFTAIGK